MENSSPGGRQRVKRCLFGKPNQREVEKWLDETSKKQLKQSRDKWSYDFELDIPIAGDVEYEALPISKKKSRKVTEFDPNIPSASSEEGNLDEEANSCHRPLTRSCTRQYDGNGSLQSRRSLKQAKLTSLAQGSMTVVAVCKVEEV
ncbi:unnamed protein product [Strongylus vulgaris]|uniref:Cyclin-dependent kinase inhibitor domain-containing protein n=1 Tax=Strongylus vulgaris TaxID=40348 RepID=A0A3P7J3A6_STRVU|nr:unnamed protein product [Strongylus vulgaris]